MTRSARLLPFLLPVAVVGSVLLAPMRPGTVLASGSPSGSFVNFESGQVRPLALSPDGTRLFAVNTPDDADMRVKGKSGALYTLANAPQTAVTIRVQLGSGTMFCASAPAKQTTARFNGAKQTPPPADCPHVPGNG